MPRATTIKATTRKAPARLPSLRDQRSASQREESDARNQKEGDDRKEKGLWKNHCSHSRMWCELQRSCRKYNPHMPSQANGSKPAHKGPSPGYTTATLSNGVTTSAIFNGKGLTVTPTSPGTITCPTARIASPCRAAH